MGVNKARYHHTRSAINDPVGRLSNIAADIGYAIFPDQDIIAPP
jgi:hypothetical protein